MTTDTVIEATARAIFKAKAEWMDKQMQRIMPPEIYALSQTDKSRDRMKLSKWMSQNKVALREHQPKHSDWKKSCSGEQPTVDTVEPAFNLSELMFGDKLVSILSFRIKGDKIESMVKDYELWPDH